MTVDGERAVAAGVNTGRWFATGATREAAARGRPRRVRTAAAPVRRPSWLLPEARPAAGATATTAPDDASMLDRWLAEPSEPPSQSPADGPTLDDLQRRLSTHADALSALRRRLFALAVAARPKERPGTAQPNGLAAVQPLRADRPSVERDDPFGRHLARALGQAPPVAPGKTAAGGRGLLRQARPDVALIAVVVALAVSLGFMTWNSVSTPRGPVQREEFDRLRVEVCRQNVKLDEIHAQLQGRRTNPLASLECQ